MTIINQSKIEVAKMPTGVKPRDKRKAKKLIRQQVKEETECLSLIDALNDATSISISTLA